MSADFGGVGGGPPPRPLSGQRFWLLASRPSYNSTVVERVLGSRRAPERNSTSALGSSEPAVKMPRGR